MNLAVLAQVVGDGVPVSLVVLGAFGGFTLNMLNLAELGKLPKERRPDFKDPLYWLLFFFWPVLGGVLTYAYEAAGRNLNEILAINVGASGPFIIRGFATANPLGRPSIDPGEGA